jgi:cytochrome P450/ferredoxin-NADP reductase
MKTEDMLRSPTGCPVSHKAAAFDVFEGEYHINPAEALKWSRDDEPVFYNPKLGYWVVSRYDDVKSVFRDNILFSPCIALEKITPAPQEAVDVLKSYGYAIDRTLVNEDEPAHMERRRVLMDSFNLEELEKHKPAIQKLTKDFMDRFIDKGKADLVAEMFKEIPLIVALHFLGVSDEDAEKIRKFSVAHTVNTWGRPTPEEQMDVSHSVGKFWQVAGDIIEKMKANPEGEGWMYHTVRQHFIYPEIVTESYLHSMMMAILAAAHETTSHATSNIFRVLLENREKWEELCDNPKLIPNAIEECLRYEGSVVAWRRQATSDTQIGDVDIPKGARLLIVLASANHDERHFENPDEIDLYRDNSTEHLTFGYGSHQCMGKNIARMELRIFLEEFIKRIPHLKLKTDQEYKFLPNTSFRGSSELWVVWDPDKNPERLDPAILKVKQDFKIGPPSKNEISRKVTLSDILQEADNIIRVKIKHPSGKPLPKWSAGSHLDLIVGDYNRKYSLCGNMCDQHHYEIAILKEDDGRGGSNFFHHTLKSGDMVQIVGPKNHFRLDESADHYILIAGGIGITPIIAMADRLKELNKKYTIHYTGRSLSKMAFVERLKRDHNVNLALYLKDEDLRMKLDQITDSLQVGQQIYACGPDSLLNELDELSTSWLEGTLHCEHFNAVTSKLNPDNEHAFEVELMDSGITVNVNADETILDALLAVGIDVPYDCKEGICGTCEVDVFEGKIDHRDQVLTNTEKQKANRMMTCCSRASENKLKLTL